MDIEILRELIPLMQDAGEGSFWLIFIYLLDGYLVTIATFTAFVTASVLLAKTVKNYVSEEQFIRAVFEVANKDPYYCLNKLKQQEVLDKLKQYKNK